jgi:hypothetical protein
MADALTPDYGGAGEVMTGHDRLLKLPRERAAH